MVLKLHGAAISPYTSRVLLVAKELGIDIELVPLNFYKQEDQHKKKMYVETLQPFGKTPLLVSQTGDLACVAY